MNASIRVVCGVALALLSCGAAPPRADVTVASPNGRVRFVLHPGETGLSYAVTFGTTPALDRAPLGIVLDGVPLSRGVEVGEVTHYRVRERYPLRGVRSEAVHHANGAKVALTHVRSKTRYTLEVQAQDDGVAFRFVVPGGDRPRVPDEGTAFRLPAGSVVWHHGLERHYEDVHACSKAEDVKSGEWVAPPLTARLPARAGYVSITEAGLRDYGGMVLQADGRGEFLARLGHAAPPGYPFRLRFGPKEGERLAKPAAMTGTITTPWRVILVGADLNALVQSDLIPNVVPPPDPKLFPRGAATEWIKPGRCVWKYLDGGPSTLEGMKEFSRLAGQLGFEYHLVEGFWQRWSDRELSELVTFSRKHNVGIWLWKHSKDIRDPAQRRAFFEKCRDAGVVGVKLDFFDHEAREVIDLYHAALRDAAACRLMVNFHGANKPTGEARTWPNELTREAIFGLENRRHKEWARHNTTLPFTRMLAGHADYTPVHFGERRKETSAAHQIATAAIFTSPLLVYGAHPRTLLDHPAAEMIKSVPSVWDETIVLPVSAIGERAAFARRSGNRWFVAVLNGPDAKEIRIPLSFLGKGAYDVLAVRDVSDDAAAVGVTRSSVGRTDALTIGLRAGGGFIARLSPAATAALGGRP